MQGKQEVEVQLYVLCGQVHAINGEETVTTPIFTQGKAHRLHLFSSPPHPVPGLNLGRCRIPDKPSASELDFPASSPSFHFETGFDQVAQAGSELPLQHRLAQNL